MLVLAAFSPALAIAAPAQASTRFPGYVVANGVTQPIFSYERAIRESVWVDIEMDLDADGAPDRVAVDIIRPAEPAWFGARVPVIMDVSPYYACCGRGNERQLKTYAPDGTPTGFPLFYDNYFVPRGYAVALVDLASTNRSTGCDDSGGPANVASGKAVIDWLNGRASGYRTLEGNGKVRAKWASGAVGMIGKSADGAMAMGVASTGVQGLKTIVPVAGVSTYYDIFNWDGASVGFTPNVNGVPFTTTPEQFEKCLPFFDQIDVEAGEDGNYNEFWQTRNAAETADQIDATVFAIQGFNDLPVRSQQFGKWWDALAEHGVTRKAWLHQAGHVDPFDLQRGEWVQTLHRWFDRWLLGVPNGIEHEPQITIEHTPDEWVDEATWPPVSTATQTLWPSSGTTPGLGGLSGEPATDPQTEAFVDDPLRNSDEWVADLASASPERVAFTGEPLGGDVRLSGSGFVTVNINSTLPEARVSAVLVDIGPATIRDHAGFEQSIRTLTTRSCWGKSTPLDSACYLDTETATVDVTHELIARGTADIGHYASLQEQLPLSPDESYSLRINLSTVDHIVPAGHRLALVVAGTDWFFFDDPNHHPTLTLDLTGSSLSLPVASGSLT